MTTDAYRAGFQAYLNPKRVGEYITNDEAEWRRGWDAAREIDQRIKSKPTFTAFLTDDGLIDMFIVQNGKPAARVKNPTETGSEALELARAYLEHVSEEPEEEPEDNASVSPAMA